MNNRQVEQKVRNAYQQITPDVIDEVLSDCQQQKERIYRMTERKTRNNRLVPILASFIILAVAFFGINNYRMNQLISTVSLDVNPSIEINVNTKEKVLAVTPKNEEAKIVIGDMNFEGNDLDVTVNALIGSMLRNGYINDLKNSILISVENKNHDKAVALEEKLSAEISTLLQTDLFEGAVLSQTVDADDALKAKADQYNITVGKVQLIEEIITNNPLYSFEKLAPLSINELSLINNKSTQQSSVVTTLGSSSDKAYIGKRKLSLSYWIMRI